MSESLQHIENFFQGVLNESERKAFEQAIIQDPQFASEVAWYIAGTSAIKEQNLAIRKENLRKLYNEERIQESDKKIKETEQLYDQSVQESEKKIKETKQLYDQSIKETGQPDAQSIKRSDPLAAKHAPVFRMWKYVSAAAAVLVLVMITWFFNSGTSPVQMADNYIKTELSDLGASMSAATDSIETARQLVNEAAYDKALSLLNYILTREPSNVKALEYAGIAALQKEDYSTALVHFKKLGSIEGVYSNPGKFYTALTLMKRNERGDKDIAQDLLQQVLQNKLGRYEIAGAWLKNW